MIPSHPDTSFQSVNLDQDGTFFDYGLWTVDDGRVGTVELIEHTGDIGIQVSADTLQDLFATAARGMYDIMVDAPGLTPQREDAFIVEGETDELLRAWLGELLYRFCTEEIIYTEYDLEFEPGRLRARVRGQVMDRVRHALRTELKAVTYHGLSVVCKGGRWTAQVVFDI